MPPADTGRPLLQFRIVLALPLGKGLACLGWTHTADACIERCTVFFDEGGSSTLERSDARLQLLHTAAPELDDSSTPHGPGFILWLSPRALKPGLPQGTVPMLTLNDQVAELERPVLATAQQVLEQDRLVSAYGTTLLALAVQHNDRALQHLLRPRLQQLRDERSRQFGRVDQVWHLHDVNKLLLTGRLACQPQQLTHCSISSGKQQLDLTAQLLTNAVTTAWDNKGRSLHADACAFALLLDANEPALRVALAAPGKKPGAKPLVLQLHSSKLASLTLPLQPLPGSVQQLPEILALAPAVAQALLTDLFSALPGKPSSKQSTKPSTARGTARQPDSTSIAQHHALQLAAQALFTQQWQQAGDLASHADLCSLKLTKACALEAEGLLLLGAFVRPASLPFKFWLHAEGQAPLDVSERLQFLPLHQGLDRLRKHFPQASEQLYFILHAPLPTQGGEPRLLRAQLRGAPDLWLKVQTAQPQLRGVDQVKAFLAEVPHGEYLWRNFKTICDAGLGRALHWLGRPPATRSTVVAEQFGTPPRKPTVSIIVPLYGRFDFMRHQLAQFCKDPDLHNVDLIYVVDDPSIHAAVLAAASHYQPLFGVPLRVLTYAENRGFAGANNSAVPFARAPLLLLLNSDVLPQQPGWLTTLRRACTRLPQCGMVGPLLQFPEGSVQHAGMAATRQANNPGLVFSHHPGKGGAWDGGNAPSEQPLLTGACLLLSKHDYAAAGGLDEDYLVGDFEDSDFSLRLRALGKRLYLVPAARLWHLERQSQYLGNNATAVRDMLTLYNAWRYHRKIAAGTLPDPEQLTAQALAAKAPAPKPRAAKRPRARS